MAGANVLSGVANKRLQWDILWFWLLDEGFWCGYYVHPQSATLDLMQTIL